MDYEMEGVRPRSRPKDF